MTSLLPSRSTATTSCAPQSASHRRPSWPQRGDSPNTRPVIKVSANMEPLEVDDEAQKRLKHAENQHRDVSAASPVSPAQAGDDSARHEGKDDEAKDVVPVGHVASADCPRRQKMAEQASGKEQHTDPSPAATYPGTGHRAWPSRCIPGRLTH